MPLNYTLTLLKMVKREILCFIFFVYVYYVLCFIFMYLPQLKKLTMQYTQNHQTVHFNEVNYIVCELHLSKTAKKITNGTSEII